MAYSFVTYLGNGAQTDFAIPFPYLEQAHVEGSVAAVPAAITFPNAATARFPVAPAPGAIVALRRNTSRAARIVDYASSATITEKVLDDDSLQAFYLAQEAFDQATSAAYFTADAGGSRVTNVADPILDTDAVTKGYMVSYLSALGLGGGGGLDLRPLNNTWTGTNLFNSTVSVKGAVFDGVDVAARELLKLNKGLYVYHETNHPTEFGYGFATQVRRTTGAGTVVGIQANGFGLGTWFGQTFGSAFEGWKGRDSTGTTTGTEASIINLNPANLKMKIGLASVFKNREDGATQGGNAINVLGTTGYGTGANYYNQDSVAFLIDSQPRSDGGATYVGWNQGVVFRDNWADVARVAPYDNARAYFPGERVISGGVAYQCTAATSAGLTPPNISFWTILPGGDARKAVGIDFSGVSADTASRIAAAVKLRGQMPIMWDTEEAITTKFDPLTARWSLFNTTVERFGVDVASGNVLVNNVPRVLATQSAASAHRNYAPLILSPGWNMCVCGAEYLDMRAEHSTGTGRFTPTTAGVYLITAQVQTETSAPAGDSVYAGIFKNGVVVKAGNAVTAAYRPVTAAVTALVQLNGTTDYVEMQAYWGGGGTCSISGEPSATFFQATKLA